MARKVSTRGFFELVKLALMTAAMVAAVKFVLTKLGGPFASIVAYL